MDKLEDFKKFIKDKPYLANKVKDGTFSWQTLYETYDLFGPEHDFFLDDSKKEETTEDKQNDDAETDTKTIEFEQVSEEVKILIDKCQEFDKYISGLTPTEKKIYDMYLDNMTSAQILEELHITNNTLKFHNKNIYSKLNVNSRKQLIEIGKMHKSGEYKGFGGN